MPENKTYNRLMDMIQEAINQSPNHLRIASLIEAFGHRTLTISRSSGGIDVRNPTIEISLTVENETEED